MGLETLLPVLIRYVLIPEIARVVRGNPQLTDEQILAQLPADVGALATSNQAFLDGIRAAAGKQP
jgi:hypothetical protein